MGLLGNAADIYPEILARGIVPDIVTDQTSAHDLVYGYIPAGHTLEAVAELRRTNIPGLMDASRASIVRHVTAMLGFKDQGAVVFDNGNLIRTHASQGGVQRAFEIPVFTEAFLRPLFARAIGPFRWIALSNDPTTSARSTISCSRAFPTTPSSQTGSGWRARKCHSKACPRASHGSATASAPSWRWRSTAWCARAS